MKDDLEEVILIVPAKGTSTRVLKKNMRYVGRKRLWQHAVERCLDSRIGDTYLSTESEELWEQATLETSYVGLRLIAREKSLSQDNTRAVDVCLDVIKNTEVIDKKIYTTMILTLPTSPLADAIDLVKAYQFFLQNYRKPVMSVNKVEGNPGLSLAKTKNDRVYIQNENWQELNNYHYRCNGAVFICDIKSFQEEKEFYMKDLIGFEMPEDRGLDINTPFDLKVANLLWREKNENSSN